LGIFGDLLLAFRSRYCSLTPSKENQDPCLKIETLIDAVGVAAYPELESPKPEVIAASLAGNGNSTMPLKNSPTYRSSLLTLRSQLQRVTILEPWRTNGDQMRALANALGYPIIRSGSFFGLNPRILGCRYANEDLQDGWSCPFFVPTFTNAGVAFTYNAETPMKMLYPGSSRDAFKHFLHGSFQEEPVFSYYIFS